MKTRIPAPVLILLLLSLSVASLASCARGFEPPVNRLRSELDIQLVLNAQVKAWNEGDLAEFMSGYWNSPELTFISGSTRIKGWEATLTRYQRRYASQGREMGTLGFHDLEIEVFSEDAAFARGRFQLDLSDGTTHAGRFTLIFRRFGEDWKIVHDHTSS